MGKPTIFEGQDLGSTKALTSIRWALLKEIKQILEPHLYASGYRKALNPKLGIVGGTRPLRLWVPRDTDGKIIDRDWDLGGYVIETLQGLTEDGVIETSSVGLVTYDWDVLPVEDLVKLRVWLVKHLSTQVPAVTR